jgi:hypothetical protein
MMAFVRGVIALRNASRFTLYVGMSTSTKPDGAVLDDGVDGCRK